MAAPAAVGVGLLALVGYLGLHGRLGLGYTKHKRFFFEGGAAPPGLGKNIHPPSPCAGGGKKPKRPKRSQKNKPTAQASVHSAHKIKNNSQKVRSARVGCNPVQQIKNVTSKVTNVAVKSVPGARVLNEKIDELHDFMQQIKCETDSIIYRIKDKMPMDEYKKLAEQLRGKIISIDFRHIFDVMIKETTKRSGHIQYRIHGFHHDFQHALERSGMIKVFDKVMGPGGSYKVDVMVGDVLTKNKTFFPAHWTRQEVCAKALEALKNLTDLPELQNNGNWAFLGETAEGVVVRVVINVAGMIESVYPIIEKISK